MTKDTEALQRRSAEPSDGEIYSLASFGGDANAKARFVAGLIEKVEQAPATPASDVAPVEYETLIAAGFDEYAAHCALRTEPDGGFCHAYFYSDGQWRFQTDGNDLTLADGTILRCVLTKRLFAHPPAHPVDPAGGEALREALKDMARGVFIDAATQTHHSWVDGTNGREPDFDEAAGDYAEGFADAYADNILAALKGPAA